MILLNVVPFQQSNVLFFSFQSNVSIDATLLKMLCWVVRTDESLRAFELEQQCRLGPADRMRSCDSVVSIMVLRSEA